MKLLFLQFSLVMLFLGNQGYSQQKVKLLPELEQSILMVEEAWNMLDASIDEVWPGFTNYDSLSFFTAVVGEQDLLINPPANPKEGFKLIEKKIREKDIYVRIPGQVEKVWGGAYRYRIDGKRYKGAQFSPPAEAYSEKAWKTRVNNYGVPGEQEKFRVCCHAPEFIITIIIHETFHRYQEEVNRMKGINRQHPSPYSLDDDYQALLEREGQLLAMAFTARDKDEVIDLAEQFLKTRDLRRSRLTPEDIMWENRNELMEGSATYFQTKVFDVLAERGYKSQSKQGIKYYGDEWPSINKEMLVYAIKNTSKLVLQKGQELQHCYFFGLAQCYILDVLCGNEWKEKIFQDDVWLDDLINACLRPTKQTHTD